MTTENTQMEAQAHRGKDLSYLTVYPENYQPELEYPVVIMLHGFGANMYDLANPLPVGHPNCRCGDFSLGCMVIDSSFIPVSTFDALMPRPTDAPFNNAVILCFTI